WTPRRSENISPSDVDAFRAGEVGPKRGRTRAVPQIAHGVLSFERAGAATVVGAAYAKSPLRLLTPRNHGAAAWAYTSTLGGGFVDGDRVARRIAAGERWALDRCSLALTARHDGRTFLDESWLLDPSHGSLGARLGRFEALATVLIAGPLFATLGDRWRAELDSQPPAARAAVLE